MVRQSADKAAGSTQSLAIDEYKMSGAGAQYWRSIPICSGGTASSGSATDTLWGYRNSGQPGTFPCGAGAAGDYQVSLANPALVATAGSTANGALGYGQLGYSADGQAAVLAVEGQAVGSTTQMDSDGKPQVIALTNSDGDTTLTRYANWNLVSGNVLVGTDGTTYTTCPSNMACFRYPKTSVCGGGAHIKYSQGGVCTGTWNAYALYNARSLRVAAMGFRAACNMDWTKDPAYLSSCFVAEMGVQTAASSVYFVASTASAKPSSGYPRISAANPGSGGGYKTVFFAGATAATQNTVICVVRQTSFACSGDTACEACMNTNAGGTVTALSIGTSPGNKLCPMSSTNYLFFVTAVMAYYSPTNWDMLTWAVFAATGTNVLCYRPIPTGGYVSGAVAAGSIVTTAWDAAKCGLEADVTGLGVNAWSGVTALYISSKTKVCMYVHTKASPASGAYVSLVSSVFGGGSTNLGSAIFLGVGYRPRITPTVYGRRLLEDEEGGGGNLTIAGPPPRRRPAAAASPRCCRRPCCPSPRPCPGGARTLSCAPLRVRAPRWTPPLRAP